jgi:hypothetical protein
VTWKRERDDGNSELHVHHSSGARNFQHFRDAICPRVQILHWARHNQPPQKTTSQFVFFFRRKNPPPCTLSLATTHRCRFDCTESMPRRKLSQQCTNYTFSSIAASRWYTSSSIGAPDRVPHSTGDCLLDTGGECHFTVTLDVASPLLVLQIASLLQPPQKMTPRLPLTRACSR